MGCSSSKKALDTIEDLSRDTKSLAAKNILEISAAKGNLKKMHSDMQSIQRETDKNVNIELSKYKDWNERALMALENMHDQVSEAKRILREQMRESLKVESNIEHLKDLSHKYEELIKDEDLEEDRSWMKLPLQIMTPVNNMFIPVDTIANLHVIDDKVLRHEWQMAEILRHNKSLAYQSKPILSTSKAPWILHVVAVDGAGIERSVEADQSSICIGKLDCGSVIEAFKCVETGNGNRKFRLRPFGWIFEKNVEGDPVVVILKENKDYDHEEEEEYQEEMARAGSGWQPSLQTRRKCETHSNTNKPKKKRKVLKPATTTVEFLDITIPMVGLDGLGVFVVNSEVAVSHAVPTSKTTTVTETVTTSLFVDYDSDEPVEVAASKKSVPYRVGPSREIVPLVTAGEGAGDGAVLPKDQILRSAGFKAFQESVKTKKASGIEGAGSLPIGADPDVMRKQTITYLRYLQSGELTPSQFTGNINTLGVSLPESVLMELSIFEKTGSLDFQKCQDQLDANLFGKSLAPHIITSTGLEPGDHYGYTPSMSGGVPSTKVAARMRVIGFKAMPNGELNPAMAAGLRQDDIIEQVNGQYATSIQEALSRLRNLQGSVTLRVLRLVAVPPANTSSSSGRSITVQTGLPTGIESVRLSSPGYSSSTGAYRLHLKILGVKDSGLGLILDKAPSGEFRGKNIARMRVFGLRPQLVDIVNPCTAAGVREGDIIEQVNGKTFRSRQELVNSLLAARGTVFMTVLRTDFVAGLAPLPTSETAAPLPPQPPYRGHSRTSSQLRAAARGSGRVSTAGGAESTDQEGGSSSDEDEYGSSSGSSSDEREGRSQTGGRPGRGRRGLEGVDLSASSYV